MAIPPFPILFIGPADTRGAIMASGVLARLADEIPGARFTLILGKQAAPLFTALPGREETIISESSKPPLTGVEKRREWGLIVDLRGTGLAAGLKRKRRAELKVPGHVGAEAARLFDFDPPPPTRLWPVSAVDERAEQLAGGGAPVLAIAPTAEWLGKTWPIERYSLTAIQLVSAGGPLAGGKLLVLNGGGDPRAADPLLKTLPADRTIDLTNETDLSLIEACLRRCAAFIGGDVLAAHLAAAAGIPTLTLFGPSLEEQNAPIGPLARSLRGPRGFQEIKAADPNLNQALCHMMDLTAEAVVAEAKALIAGEPSPNKESPE
ncbi:MAG: glycosyltransferase family 9 protein [Caulobacteraceae bacterium]